MRYIKLVIVLLAVTLIQWVTSTKAMAAATGTWMAAAPMMTPRYAHSAITLGNGKVLVMNGTYQLNEVNAPEMYDPATDTWTALAQVSPRPGASVTLLADGKVLMAGGWGYNGGTTVELYDPQSDSWSEVAPMAVPRSGHHAVLLLDGKVLVIGGFFVSGILQSAELYDPATNSWAPAAPMSTPRDYSTATRLPGGKVLVAGGYPQNYPQLAGLSTAEIYDPETNSWSAAGIMSTSRLRHTATLLASGKVLVVGGDNSLQSGSGLPNSELYDPATNSWASAAPAGIMYAHTAVLLQNKKVLVAGGVRNDGQSFLFLSDAVLYDPDSDSWSSAGSFSVPRTLHSAALLPDGRVLVTGGYSDEFVDLNTAELYNPSGGTYQFTGFLPPLEKTPAVNSARAGQTIPIKWRITEPGGAAVFDAGSFVGVTSYPVACSQFTGNVTLNADQVAPGNSGLQYLGDGYWQYNWKTSEAYSGQCRVVKLSLKDGSSHEARFNFVK